jgi:predicted nuclease of predicted toxin-antitoxin system
MRLLFDENLSPRLVGLLHDPYRGSRHVEDLGLRGQSDRTIWDYARQNEYVIVSKDNDFRQLSFLLGPPPKVIWLSVGNAGTEELD